LDAVNVPGKGSFAGEGESEASECAL
jgi:hypothetical protein